MNFRTGETERRVRAEVDEFLREHLTADVLERMRTPGTLHHAGFHKAMAQQGWIGVDWPSDVGGLAWSGSEAGVLHEALEYAGAPVNAQQLSELLGYTLCVVGTPEQKAEFLPRILNGEMLFSLGYSEPDAGSDLAAVSTRAERVEGGYLINGAKMFTTMADISQYVCLLARTDRTVPKHRGLSLFLVPLDASGIEISPVETFGGEQTNATFYRDVFVEDWLLVGDENRGWDVLMLALDAERALIGGYVGQATRAYDDLRMALAETGRLQEPLVRHRLAFLRAKLDAAAALSDRVYCMMAAGRAPNVESSMTKLYVTEVFKDLAYEALDLVGPAALATHEDEAAPAGGRLEHTFRHAQIATIYGGSNEVQRNIIAHRGLGLPRVP